MEERLIKKAQGLLKEMEDDRNSNLNDMGKEEFKFTDLSIHAMRMVIARMHKANEMMEKGK